MSPQYFLHLLYSPEYHFYGSPPDPVQELKASQVGYKQVSLTWKDTGSKAEGYHIYRTVSGKSTLIGYIDADVKQFTDKSPLSGAIAKYEVMAYNATGESMARALSVTVPKAFAFNDITAYKWAHDAISTLGGLGALEYNNGNFEPEKALTRGQMARMILRALDIAHEPQKLSPVTDLHPNHTYYQDLRTAIELGLIHPDVQGKIYPDQAVTRRELILFLNNSLNKLGRALSSHDENELRRFVDYDTVSINERTIISSFAGDGLISGKSGERLALADRASRVEGVVIIYRTMRRYPR